MVGCGYRLDEIYAMPISLFLALKESATKRMNREKSSYLNLTAIAARSDPRNIAKVSRQLDG